MANTIQKSAGTNVRTYAELRRAVGAALSEGRSAAEALKVEIYRRTGSFIQAYVERHPEEAVYGKGLFKRLGRDLKMEPSSLNRMFKFVRLFPNSAARPNLKWSHYRVLMTISDEKQRSGLAKQAAENKWPAQYLEERVQKAFQKSKLSSGGESGARLAEPVKGEPGAVRIGWVKGLKDSAPRRVLDYGFWIYREASVAELKKFQKGDWVRRDESNKKWKVNPASDDAYVYSARVERVVDGDTLLVHVNLPSKILHRQYLRLAGINAPALKTQAGLKVMKYLEKLIHKLPSSDIIFRSRQMDRYDRAISDVWIGDTYLNQALLDTGHVVKYGSASAR